MSPDSGRVTYVACLCGTSKVPYCPHAPRPRAHAHTHTRHTRTSIRIHTYPKETYKFPLPTPFADLYAQPNLGIPVEEVDEEEPPVEEEPEEEPPKKPTKSKGGKVAEPEPEPEPEVVEVSAEMKAQEETKQRILDRAGLIQDRLETRLMEVVQLEDYIVERTHIMENEEKLHTDVMRRHGLFPGMNEPEGPTYFKIDQRALETHKLIDLGDIMRSVKKEKLDETLQRVVAKPPRDGTKSRRKQEEEDQKRMAAAEEAVPIRAPDRIKNMTPEERKAKIAQAQKRRKMLQELMPMTELQANKK